MIYTLINRGRCVRVVYDTKNSKVVVEPGKRREADLSPKLAARLKVLRSQFGDGLEIIEGKHSPAKDRARIKAEREANRKALEAAKEGQDTEEDDGEEEPETETEADGEGEGSDDDEAAPAEKPAETKPVTSKARRRRLKR